MAEFRTSIGISSDTVGPDEITRRTGLTPDRTGRRGEPPRHGAAARPAHLWVKKLTADTEDPRFEDYERALLATEDATAAALGELAAVPGTHVWLTIAQEVEDPDDSWHTGIVMSAPLLRWLATAGASINIDQYFGWE